MREKAYVTALETPEISIALSPLSTRSLPSLSKVSSRSVPRAKQLYSLPQFSSEIQEVAGLSQWTPLCHHSNTQSTVDLTQLRGRFSSDFQRLMAQRKAKFSLPPIINAPEIEEDTLDITHRRAAKLHKEHQFQSELSYSRHYEAELISTETATAALLQSLKTQRECIRKSNTFMHNQLIEAGLKSITQSVSTPLLIPSKETNKQLLKSFSHLKTRQNTIMPKFKTSVSRLLQVPKEENPVDKQKLMSDIQENAKKAAEIDKLVTKTRNELKLIQKALILHYFSILKEGKDTRDEGLVWVVKKLWNKGELTPIESFPGFLDVKTVSVILKLSEFSREIDLINAEIEKCDAGKAVAVREMECSVDKMNNVRKRLEMMGKSTLIVKKTGENANSQGDFERKIEGNNAEKESIEAKIRGFEGRSRQLREIMETVKMTEQKRLLHECCFNKLERRLGGSLKDMLATVVGLEVVKRQESVIGKELLGLKDASRRTQTYRLGKYSIHY